MTARARRDAGLTLLELIMSLALTAVIIGTLTLALIAFVTNSASNRNRLDTTAGVDVAVTYLQRDLSSATGVATSGTACSNVPNALVLTWRDWTATASSPEPSPSTSYTAAYAEVAQSNGSGPTTYALKRWYCAGAVSPAPTPLILAEGLTAANSFRVVTAPTPAPTPCATGSPVVVQMTVYATDAPAVSSQTDGCIAGRGQQ